MKKLLVGMLALGSLSAFANTNCESVPTAKEALSGKTITSRTTVRLDNLTLAQCAELAGQAHSLNLELGHKGSHTVIFSDERGNETIIKLK